MNAPRSLQQPVLAAYLRFLCVFCLVFFPVYFGCGWLTERMGRSYGLYLEWERSIPFIPQMIWPYVSLYPLFTLPLLHLTPSGLDRLTRQSVVVLLAAGALFLLAPGRLGFGPAPDVSGLNGAMIDIIRSVDTPHNLVPSLHVAFACLILVACAPVVSRPLAIAYGSWVAIMAISTLLVHQHHIADAVSGAALAFAVSRFMPMRAVRAARQ